MLKTSEWVSLGHPDKVADFISCYLLDRYLERDPMTRFAVEVQIKGPWVTLGGEISQPATGASAHPSPTQSCSRPWMEAASQE